MLESEVGMAIKKVIISNFKQFKDIFEIELNEDINILVGNNEAGKSTIIEAINLAFTGMIDGKYIKNEITQHLFNNEAVKNYVDHINQDKAILLPSILIEVHFDEDDDPNFIGTDNIRLESSCGFSFKIQFNEDFKEEYETFIQENDITSLPIEYYDVEWSMFSRKPITTRKIPLKSALIDSSNSKYKNGSDMYISRIIKNSLELKEIIDISQAHRRIRDNFKSDKSVKQINKKIESNYTISDKKVELSVELLSKNAWENSLTTYIDAVPFMHIGKGEQSMVKTELALNNKKSKKADVILIEEPENHLSYSKLNQLLYRIKELNAGKQLIISTHSSFVANKLGLKNLVLLNKQQITKLNKLEDSTKTFFEKISGYDTLRLILCKKAILVEGDSDELVIQKAYMEANNNKLPINDGIDVISVGTSFLRFLEVTEKINANVVVVTDSDGNIEALKKKYANYIGNNKSENIKICYDETIDETEITLDNGKKLNMNTLEPIIVRENGLEKMNSILETDYSDITELHKYMKFNKTECALKIFMSDDKVKFPEYILEAIK
jgi:putative ATP-dependent endonuclease of OLD family